MFKCCKGRVNDDLRGEVIYCIDDMSIDDLDVIRNALWSYRHSLENIIDECISFDSTDLVNYYSHKLNEVDEVYYSICR